MGHDSARAAMIYQHATAEADQAIAAALDRRIEGSRQAGADGQDEADDGTAEAAAGTG
jgi:hypothetical protein